MSDNIQLPVTGTGTADSVVATDDITSVHYQRVKLVDGTLGGTDAIAGDATNGLDVDVTRLPAIPAGTNNIGDVDVLTVPAPLSTTGGGTEATALRVTIANDSTGLMSIDDNGGSLTVDGSVSLAAAIPAGSNNIGDVDVLSVPAPLSTTGSGTEATALRVTVATDSTGVLSVDDNGGSLTVDGTVALSAGSANIGDVDVLTVPAPLSTTGGGTEATALRVTIATDSTGVLSIDDNGGAITVDGTVTAAQATSANLQAQVQGPDAHDAPVAGNPVLQAGRASAAAPSDVSGDGDVVRAWLLRNGAQATVLTAAGALIGGDAANGIDVDVTRLPALVAGTANIGDVDVLTVPAPLSTTGGGTEATALRVTVATDSTGVLSVDDNGASLTVDATGTTAHDAPGGAVNPVPNGGYASAAAPTDVSTDADIVRSWMLRNGATCVQLTAAGALIPGDATNGIDVDVTRLPALVAGSANIGDVDVLTLPNVTLAAGTNTNEVVGDVASDVPIASNPVTIGARASTAVPTAVSTDGDAVNLWANRSGAQMVSMSPQIGLNSDPWNLVHEAAQYTTTQTSTVLVTGAAGEKIVVTKVQIQAFGTTAFDLQLYFGTGAFSRGTSRACFDGTFKPSSTLAPGAIMDGPFIAGTNGDDVMVTTSANGSVNINLWYYVIT